MLPMMLACLTCLPLCQAAGKSALPTLDETGPTAQAEVDGYDLTATYEAAAPSGTVGLVVERADDRNLLVVQATGKRTEVATIADGKRTVLASGAGISLDASGELTVRRRPGRLAVFAGPRELAEGFADFRPGTCGSVAGEGVATPSDLRLQEIGDIQFDDDFFAGEEREGLWEMLTGALKVAIYWDPKQKVDNRPIGACWFANEGAGEHLAATGQDFWDDYACEVSVRPDADSTLGLAFRLHDATNYAMLTLSCEPAGNAARLTEVSDGAARTLAEMPGDWPPGHWQRLRVEVVGSHVAASVSGQPVGEAELGGWPSGRVGVYAKTQGDCRFDDLSVRGLRRVELEPKAQPQGPWRFVQGSWRAAKGRVSCTAASTAVATASAGAWADCDVRARTQPAEGSEAGLLARWSGGEGYGFLAQRTAGGLTCSLRRIRAEGESEVLAEGQADASAPSVELRVTAIGPELVGYVDGKCVVRAWDGALRLGEVGLVAEDGKAAFEGFSASDAVTEGAVSVLAEDGSGGTRPGAEHGLFERYIGDLWQPVAGQMGVTKLGDEPAIALSKGAARYYLPRFGDVSLATDVLKSDGQAISLAICCDAAGKQGYSASVTGDQLALLRNGEVAKSATLGEGLPRHLSVQRDGPFVIARAGQSVVSYRDEQPLASGYAFVRAAGQAVLDNLDLGANHALSYRFDRVEPDWVETSGQWLFHSGMACIPWAYWLSGDGREQPAMIWNRVRAPADLALHFDVSEYTEGYASGDHTHFPYHDITLVLCAQERSLDSGYRLVIGADGGRATRLLRNGQVVAETTNPRFAITMGSHFNTPRAVEVVAVKNGRSLKLWLNRVEALSYDDPEPLGNGWLALGVGKCRANFRDLFVYRDRAWETPLGVTAFSPEPAQ